MSKKNIVYLFGKQDTEPKKEEVEVEEIAFTPEEISADPMDGEAADEETVLLKLGSDKEAGILRATWDEVAAMMNDMFRAEGKPETESSWRKKYVKLKEEAGKPGSHASEIVMDRERLKPIEELIHDLEKRREQERDERNAYNRLVRSQSRQDMILDLFRETIQRYPKKAIPATPKDKKTEKGVYAMLSDIHFGLAFDSYVGTYNSAVAEERVMRYADEIILTGRREKAGVCFVSLMGDLISGVIHPTIRVENKENVIEQVVGVSELVSRFLCYLGRHFNQVFVNSVDGNHSRLDGNLENVLRKEKLDSLIPWYCKAKLADQDNIVFTESSFDNTVGVFYIGEKLFVCVHGDLEKDLKTTANALEKAMGRHIDYLLAGHMHVPEMRAEDTMYIRNGSICGSGDDYTMKKRLFCPPYQVFMILNNKGEVESIHSVNLTGEEEDAEPEKLAV